MSPNVSVQTSDVKWRVYDRENELHALAPIMKASDKGRKAGIRNIRCSDRLGGVQLSLYERAYVVATGDCHQPGPVYAGSPACERRNVEQMAGLETATPEVTVQELVVQRKDQDLKVRWRQERTETLVHDNS